MVVVRFFSFFLHLRSDMVELTNGVDDVLYMHVWSCLVVADMWPRQLDGMYMHGGNRPLSLLQHTLMLVMFYCWLYLNLWRRCVYVSTACVMGF